MFYSIKWPQILDLHQRGWKWVPYRKSTSIGKLHLTHDTGTVGINAHRQAAVAFGGSAWPSATRAPHGIRGEGRFDGTPYLAAMLGWLGDVEKAASYMHEAKASDWVHGFGVFYLEPASGSSISSPFHRPWEVCRERSSFSIGSVERPPSMTLCGASRLPP